MFSLLLSPTHSLTQAHDARSPPRPEGWKTSGFAWFSRLEWLDIPVTRRCCTYTTKLWQQPTCSILITSVKERVKNSERGIAGLNMQHADGDNCGHSRFECCELSDAVFRHLPYVSLCIIRLLFKGGEVKMPAEVWPQSAGKKIPWLWAREGRTCVFQQNCSLLLLVRFKTNGCSRGHKTEKKTKKRCSSQWDQLVRPAWFQFKISQQHTP